MTIRNLDYLKLQVLKTETANDTKDQNQECALTDVQCISATHSHYCVFIFRLLPAVTESFFQLVEEWFRSEVNVLLIRRGRNFQN